MHRSPASPQRRTRTIPTLAAVVFCCAPIPRVEAQSACPTLTIEEIAVSPAAVDVRATTDGTTQQTASFIPAAGGVWQASRTLGGTVSTSALLSVTPSTSYQVVTVFRQSLSATTSPLTCTSQGSGVVKVRVNAVTGGPSYAEVAVDVYRMVLPASGISGSATLDGNSFSVSAPRLEHQQFLYDVPVDSVIEITTGGSASLTSAGSLVTQSVVNISVAPCGTYGGDDTDDTGDDESEWSPGDDCGGGPGGPGAGGGGAGGGGGGPGNGGGPGTCGGMGGIGTSGGGRSGGGGGNNPNGILGMSIHPGFGGSGGDGDGQGEDGGGGGDCDEDDCDEGPSNAGDAMHVHLPTGNVWTDVPVLRTYAAGGVELDLHLRYESTRSGQDVLLGKGWTHSYNVYVTAGSGYATYVDGTGRRHKFTLSGGAYAPPMGRGFQLVWNSNHFELWRTNGAVEYFNTNGRIAEAVDRRGRTTRFTYDIGDPNRLTKIVSPHGRVVTLEYQSGRLWKITDPASGVTTLGYSGDKLTSVTDPNSQALGYTYESGSSGRLLTETLKNGKTYTVVYGTSPDSRTLKDHAGAAIVHLFCGQNTIMPDTRGTTFTSGMLVYLDARGNPWVINRDNLGRLRQRLSPEGRVWTQDYGVGASAGANRNRVVKLTNERGFYRTFTWDANGSITEFRDELNNLYAIGYDGQFMTHAKEVVLPNEKVWSFEYYDNGDLKKIIDPENGPDRAINLEWESHGSTDGTLPDGQPLPGRIKKLTRSDRRGNATTWEYDTLGNPVKLTRAVGTLDLITTFEHNARGQTTQRTIERGDQDVVSDWTYDQLGRLLDRKAYPTTGVTLTAQRRYDAHGNLDYVVNPRGYTTDFGYDNRNRRTSVTVAQGVLNLTTSWVLDGNGNATDVTDPNGLLTTHAYNLDNQRTETTDAAGYKTTFTPDAVGNTRLVERKLDPSDPNAPTYSARTIFDGLNRPTQRAIDPNGLAITTNITYNVSGSGGCSCGGTPGSGRPYKIVDPNSKVTYFHYDALDRRMMTVRKVGSDNGPDADSDDAATEYFYDADSNLEAVVQPMGERSEFAYDEAGRRVTSTAIHSGGDIVTTYTYNGADDVKRVDEPTGNVVELFYDGAERLTSATDSLGAVVTLTYDSNGNVLTRRPGDDPNLAWTFEYDAADRMTKAYDPLHESGSDLFSEYVYDKNGNRTFVTDNLGLVTRFEYDHLQRLIKMTENHRSSGGDATANTLTQYGYNSLRQTALIDPNGNATSYTYDAGLRLTRIRYPDHDPNFIDQVDYAYDKAGNLKTRSDQAGRVTTYTYDDLHHLTGRSYSTGGSEAFAFDRSGRLTVADNAAVTLDFEYDDLGRVRNAWQAYVSDPATYQTQYGYVVDPADANNPRRVVTYHGGRVVTERFDKRTRLASVSGGSGVGATFGYDLADRRTAANPSNGVTGTLAYDLNSRLTSIQHAKDATDLFKVEYGYDAAGNRTFTRQLTSGLTGRSELYAYDQRHRLIGFDRGTITSGSNPTLSSALADADILGAQDWSGSGWEGLDRRGNWTRTDRTVGVTPVTTPETRVADAVNQYTSIDLDGSGSGSPLTPEHDRRGNLTKDPSARNVGDGGSPTGQTFEYDEENRLVSVKRASDNATLLTIKYDALGRRAESTDYVCAGQPCGTGSSPVITRHVFDGIQTTQEYAKCPSQSWALAREFVWGDRFPQPVALVAYGGTSGGYGGSGLPSGTSVFHYLHDVLGSVVALTNSSGKVVERYTYDPYGRTVIEQTDPNSGLPVTRSDASVFGNPFGWTGQRYDGGARLYHFLYRTYLPQLGRWGQRDPAGYGGGVNLMEYVASAPLSNLDPLGLRPSDSDGRSGLEKDCDELIIRNKLKQRNGLKPAGEVIVAGVAYVRVGVVAVSIFLPGPDDAIWAAIASKYGWRMVLRGGEWVVERGWWFFRTRVPLDEIVDALKEYHKALREALTPEQIQRFNEWIHLLTTKGGSLKDFANDPAIQEYARAFWAWMDALRKTGKASEVIIRRLEKIAEKEL